MKLTTFSSLPFMSCETSIAGALSFFHASPVLGWINHTNTKKNYFNRRPAWNLADKSSGYGCHLDLFVIDPEPGLEINGQGAGMVVAAQVCSQTRSVFPAPGAADGPVQKEFAQAAADERRAAGRNRRSRLALRAALRSSSTKPAVSPRQRSRYISVVVACRMVLQFFFFQKQPAAPAPFAAHGREESFSICRTSGFCQRFDQRSRQAAASGSVSGLVFISR